MGRKGCDQHGNFSQLLVVSPRGVSKNLLKFCQEKFIVPDQAWNNQDRKQLYRKGF